MDTNLLLAISVIMVAVILISINYSEISDFYTYSVPLNGFVIPPMQYSLDPDRYQQIKQQQGSTCFVTPSNNEYCYGHPRGDADFRVTHPFGSNGINGEMHLEPAGDADGYWTMSRIAPTSKTEGVITFSANAHGYPDKTLSKWSITDDFEFTRTVEKYDTFVVLCTGGGKHAEIIQYMGIITVEGIDYVATWHTEANFEHGIPCKYPEIIQHSFEHDFGI